MKRVLLVDDQNIVLQGVAALLSVSPELEVVAALDSGEACIDWLNSGERADVILLDMHMPGIKGLDTLKQIRNIADIPVLFLTTFDDVYLRQQSAEHGARGLLHKNVGLEELVSSVLKVANGGSLLAQKGKDTLGAITPREDEIAKALVEGKTNKEIASAQNLSPGTVRNYISNLFSKLGVRNRSEAVVKLKKLGLF
jgi:two-component system response regulator DesR